MKKINWRLMDNAITFSEKAKMALFVLTSNKFTNGPKVREFESVWSKWVGSKYSLFVSSGSTANSLLIAAIKEKYKLNNGDKVLVPACTWMTSVAPIFQNNLLPVFIDISLEDYCINTDDLDAVKNIHPDIKLIFTTHLLGFHSNIAKLKEAFPNAIIGEDCCEAHGVTDELGNRMNPESAGATFSFYFGHHITTIEGGFVSTNDPELYDLMRMKRSHGLAREASAETYKKLQADYPDIIPTFLFVTDGYNFRNNEISAVLGLQQIKKLDNIISKRNQNYKQYFSIVNKYPDLFYIPKCEDTMSSFTLPFVCKNKKVYNLLIEKFKHNNIEFRPLVAGNLLRQPFLSGHRFSYRRDTYNSDIIHDLGMYIGNSHFIGKKHLNLLSKIMKELSKEYEASL
jgi:CDP-6-deoxy-D-xylo-4-hexulose-3-dehydrase